MPLRNPDRNPPFSLLRSLFVSDNTAGAELARRLKACQGSEGKLLRTPEPLDAVAWRIHMPRQRLLGFVLRLRIIDGGQSHHSRRNEYQGAIMNEVTFSMGGRSSVTGRWSMATPAATLKKI